MIKRLTICFLSLLFLLCPGGSGAGLFLPWDEWYVVYRMESYQNGQRTSHQVITAARTEAGCYFAPGNEGEFLFLRESDGQYAMYTRACPEEPFMPNSTVRMTEEKVVQFGSGVLHLGLFRRSTEGLSPGEVVRIAGRSCRVYAGAGTAGEDYFLHTRLLVDEATGLTLGHRLTYTHRETGEQTEYVMICQLLQTDHVVLPT